MTFSARAFFRRPRVSGPDPWPCARFLLASLLAAALGACVTTTQGGFDAEASSEQALADYVQLAVAYYEAGDMAGARRHVANALAIDDRNPDIHNVMALIHQSEGDTDLADAEFRRAIGYDRSNSRARNNYAVFLFSQGRFAEAYEQLQIVAGDTGYEGRPIAFENLGRSALQMGREAEAEMAFERALQLSSNLYIAAMELAQIKYNKRDLTGARSYYNRFLTLKELLGVPHTPRSLWIGIQVENAFQNNEVVQGFGRLLSTLYRDSPEYQQYRSLIDGN